MRIGICLFLVFILVERTDGLGQQRPQDRFPPVLVAKTKDVLVHAIRLPQEFVGGGGFSGDERVAIVATDRATGEMRILHSSGLGMGIARKPTYGELRILGAVALDNRLFVATWHFNHGDSTPIETIERLSKQRSHPGSIRQDSAGHPVIVWGYGGLIRYWDAHEGAKPMGSYALYMYALPNLEDYSLRYAEKELPKGIPAQSLGAGPLKVEGDGFHYFGTTISLKEFGVVK